MTGPGAATTTISGTISGVSGQAAIGTNIRQNAVFLSVEVAPGDPAALERIVEQIRLDPIAGRVTAWGRDFPTLIGRDDAVAAARDSLADRHSVAVFGEDGIGKSVLLRNVARRVDNGFTRGVALIPSGGMLWQDIGNEVVRAFFTTSLPIYLGPSQLRTVLRDLDALVVLDDVDPGARVDQLFALLENASFVVAGPERLLSGESRGIRLAGLDPAGAAALIRETLANLGAEASPDPDVAHAIAVALGGHPARIIRSVEDAHARGVDPAGLAAELQAGVEAAAAASLGRLDPADQMVVDAVAALGGAPIGPEHAAAVVPAAAAEDVEDLVRRRVLRAASPQVRLDPDVAVAVEEEPGADETRQRFVDHFVEWATSGRSSPDDIAAESRAILALLEWAERSGRLEAAHALAVATESGFALAGRWATWAQVTGYRLRSAEALGFDADAAIALNQMGVQALAADAAPRAREAFLEAYERALEAKEPGVAATAARNIEIIDAPVPPATKVSRLESLARPLFLAGLIAAAVLILLFLLNRPALAIEPASHVFEPAVVDTDGERVTFTVSNRGTTTLEALSVGLSGDAAGDFFVASGDCPGARLGGGQSCTVVLAFHPTRAGDGSATLTVSSRDGVVASASILSRAEESAAPSPSASPSPPVSPTPPPSNPPSPPVDAVADLVIRRFEPVGMPELGDLLRVPVDVEIANAGDADAGIFPTVVTADGVPVPFAVEGRDPFELLTQEPLGPGDRVTFSGWIELPPETSPDQVRLIVEADSCASDPAAPPDCRVPELITRNNSLALQVVDLQVLNVQLGEPREPPGDGQSPPPWAEVDVSFDVLNAGSEPAGEFWMAAFLGQIRADLHSDTVEYDQVRTMLRVPSLEPGVQLKVTGVALVPTTSLNSEMQIVIGCPPLSDPCYVPEIAFDNNWISVAIPPGPAPTPTEDIPG
ncbi:MAG TPA: choice-of-anchor D domain-containing protein [Clostridia bacterium]|nr:choice-of-anchor D domain-containing protein [Clostridia bacterium]